jgi:ribonuclease T
VTKREVFISVDVETAGPIPGEFSLLSIGACNVDNEKQTFACELKPITRNADPKALEVSGLSLDELERTGLAPKDAMLRFAEWLRETVGDGSLVFVGFNAPFDWSFVNYYFHRFTGSNPFGFTALDIKAYYMGLTGCAWSDTRSSRIELAMNPKTKSDHDALHDAQYQAELFRLMRLRVSKS